MRRLWRVLFMAVLAASLGQSCSPQDIISGTSGNTTADTSLQGINGGEPTTQAVPEIGAPVSIQIVSQSAIDARVLIRYLVANTESHLADLQVPAMATLEPVGPDLATLIQVSATFADGRSFPAVQLRLGQDFVEGDLKTVVLTDPDDACPLDPNKTVPGVCGCGVPDTDTDGDGTPDCIDLCPADPFKIAPGACGCGVADTDTDGDGTPDCLDLCPEDPHKIAPGACGCGVADTDTDGDGTPDCLDLCPEDPQKTAPGVCGCGHPDIDSDGDGVLDCLDACPNDPHKSADPGVCGCGHPDIDSDGDGILDCLDNCPNVYNPDQQDFDHDGVGSACEIRADLDGDNDVDLDDFGILQSCLVEPGPQCYRANIDRDPDCIIDQHDVDAFNFCFTGPGVPLETAPPACWGEEISLQECSFGPGYDP